MLTFLSAVPHANADVPVSLAPANAYVPVSRALGQC